MTLGIRPYADGDAEILRALLHDPSIAPQFDKFLGPDGLEHKLADRVLARECLRLAFADGVPVGFGVAWVIVESAGFWAMTRVAVLAAHRRRGIGRALADAVVARALALAPPERPAEIAGAAWMPMDAAAAMAASMGFAPERTFWLMERRRGGLAEPAWPAGVEVRTWDGSDAMLREWTAVYNDSFANHYRFLRADEEDGRRIASSPHFRPDGLLLAYLGGRCAGFCRIELHETRGEIGTLGTAHEARGLGLGRALLRWGVRWLETNTALPVTLLVDGENENALRLYRGEGFAIARTRQLWGRTFAPGESPRA